MSRGRFLVPLAAVAMLLLVGVNAATTRAVLPTAPTISPQDLAWYMVTDAVDASNAASVVSSPVDASAAASIARGVLARPDTNVTILQARAQRIASEPARLAWVVLFNGGNAPHGGPAGATQFPVHMTGVIIDAQTGSLMSVFMH